MERVKIREWMVRKAGIKTERIRSGMCQLYYKHIDEAPYPCMTKAKILLVEVLKELED